MLINGEPGDTIRVTDRGLLYGDGVFETVRLINHQLCLWPQHQQRLIHACKLFGIPLVMTQLQSEINRLIDVSPADGIVKVIITRGSGGRGYKPPKESQSNSRIVQFHPMPNNHRDSGAPGVRVKMCKQVLSTNSVLGGIKHLGRLDQVLASAELGDDFSEGVMATDSGFVIEGTKSNLFIVMENQVITPDLSNAGVQGIMRDFLIERFNEAGTEVKTQAITKTRLINATELFLCNSVFGVWPVIELAFETNAKKYKIGPLSRLAIEFTEHEFGSYR